MDTLSIIILTAVINAIVTGTIGGIILYRIQKRIDNSYFEYQTKFSLNHPKTVETLKTLYQKFIASNKATEEAIWKSRKLGTIKDAGNWSTEYDSFLDTRKDFENYFDDNRIFLTAKLVETVSHLKRRTEWMHISICLESVLKFVFNHR